jgi:hypothetical protein
MTRIENMNLGYSDMDILKAVDHWKKYFHARGTQKMTRKGANTSDLQPHTLS